ncbi:uncharacterized protein LOC121878269 [Homarus americanus]|uniref:Secreted protein n=1 Tax=Homarus americanus TaxID=6706 RepID=A0A8J5JPU3_HOMAM|nr:uncharacterized protein LOC121878269 [Homarus americanus]KAG7158834.1 hypothetical protein Hamer_G023708 [Homarus americanus]
MWIVRWLTAMVVVTVSVEARPQLVDVASMAASGDFGGAEIAGKARSFVSNLAADTVGSVRVLGEGTRDVIKDMWNNSKQTMQRFTAVATDTVDQNVQGVRDAIRTTNTFVADGAQEARRLAEGAAQSTLGVIRDAVNSNGQFLEGVRKMVLQGVVETGQATGDFVQQAVTNAKDFVEAGTGVVSRVVTQRSF